MVAFLVVVEKGSEHEPEDSYRGRRTFGRVRKVKDPGQWEVCTWTCLIYKPKLREALSIGIGYLQDTMLRF